MNRYMLKQKCSIKVNLYGYSRFYSDSHFDSFLSQPKNVLHHRSDPQPVFPQSFLLQEQRLCLRRSTVGPTPAGPCSQAREGLYPGNSPRGGQEWAFVSGQEWHSVCSANKHVLTLCLAMFSKNVPALHDCTSPDISCLDESGSTKPQLRVTTACLVNWLTDVITGPPGHLVRAETTDSPAPHRPVA